MINLWTRLCGTPKFLIGDTYLACYKKSPSFKTQCQFLHGKWVLDQKMFWEDFYVLGTNLCMYIFGLTFNAFNTDGNSIIWGLALELGFFLSGCLGYSRPKWIISSIMSLLGCRSFHRRVPMASRTSNIWCKRGYGTFPWRCEVTSGRGESVCVSSQRTAAT